MQCTCQMVDDWVRVGYLGQYFFPVLHFLLAGLVGHLFVGFGLAARRDDRCEDILVSAIMYFIWFTKVLLAQQVWLWIGVDVLPTVIRVFQLC